MTNRGSVSDENGDLFNIDMMADEFPLPSDPAAPNPNSQSPR